MSDGDIFGLATIPAASLPLALVESQAGGDVVTGDAGVAATDFAGRSDEGSVGERSEGASGVVDEGETGTVS